MKTKVSFVSPPPVPLLSFPRARAHSTSFLSVSLAGVVSATINVLTELARKNAKNYLPLAPQLFDILSKSQNNWMLIKVVKLVRPRLLLAFLSFPLSDFQLTFLCSCRSSPS